MPVVPRPLRSPWALGGVLGAYYYVVLAVQARIGPVERFDGGIQSTTITYLLQGQIPVTDFYVPYGIGLGVPGVIPRLLGFDGLFAERMVYAVFPAAVTVFATVFFSRRCGAALGLLVGLVTLASGTSRYSLAWLALLGFLILLDHAGGTPRDRSLRGIAAERPRTLLAAGAVLSLAGWARLEYAAFVAVWAVILAVVLTGRRRWRLSAATFALGLLPTAIVVVTGGAGHLSWFIRYLLSEPPEGFRARRGQPILWHFAPDRISELAHGKITGPAAAYVGSYGVGLACLVAAVVMLLSPRGRHRLLRRDPTYAAPFMVVVSALVLYGQAARFSDVYGLIAVPVFWGTAALLLGRLSPFAFVAVAALLAWPLVDNKLPTEIQRAWRTRPSVTAREPVPHFNRIPLNQDEAQSLAALPRAWKALGLGGRRTISVSRRNDIAWANDAIVGFVLDAPPAAWPLTYDPGLVNRDAVQAEVVRRLCANRAPVVQTTGDYPDPHGVAAWVGSRRLDAFLAVNYRVRAVAGFYRILLPTGNACVRPENLSLGQLAARRDALFARGELPAAGSVAIARLERTRGRSMDDGDAAIASLGGYRLATDQLPAGPVGTSLLAMQGDLPAVPPEAMGAARTDVQRLAVETAWIAHHRPDDPSMQDVAAAVLALARAHPRWGQALENVAAIVPPSRDLVADLARRGATGVLQFDKWRLSGAMARGDVAGALRAGERVVADNERDHDPVAAGNAELQLAAMPGLSAPCSLALRRRADARPGVWAPTAPGSSTCPELR
jgi:hypothetical protein